MASLVRPVRPASVVFLAVCQFVGGGVGIVYEIAKAGSSLFLMLAPAAAKAAAAANPAVGLTLQAPYYLQTQLAASLFGLVLSIVLIADGVGLLMMRRWAYNLGVLYGWLSVIYQVAWMAYLILIAVPIILAGLDNMPLPPGVAPGTNPQAYRNILYTAEMVDVGSTAAGLIYPIFVLIMLAATRKAFRRPAAAREGFKEGDEGARAADEQRVYTAEPDDRIGPARS